MHTNLVAHAASGTISELTGGVSPNRGLHCPVPVTPEARLRR
jgi:hypothetical protein